LWDVKYRPLTFTDVLGQEGTVQVLRARLMRGSALDTSYIFSGGHGRGKCIVGSTLVITDRGTLPIEVLMGGPGCVESVSWGVAKEGSGRALAAYSYRGGIQDTIRVRTHMGFVIEGTHLHRVRVLAESGCVEWRHLSQLRKGDHVCLARGTQLFGPGASLASYRYIKKQTDHSSREFNVPIGLDTRWGRLLGYLVGDGSVTARKSVSVHTEEPDVIEDARSLLHELGGAVGISPDKRRKHLVAVRCAGVQFRDFLAFLGVGYVKAGEKRVPWAVLVSPEEVVRSFLRGYFELDGGASGGFVEALTKSPVLAEQVQVLLLNLGIVSRRFPKKHKKYGLYWRVRIARTSLGVFQEKVGFVSNRKSNQLRSILDRDHAKGQRDLVNFYEVVPHQATHLAEFYKTLPKTLRDRETSHFFRARRGKVSCTNRQVRRIADDFSKYSGASHFEHLLSTGYYFDRIEEVTTGRSEVFDLNVPDGEMFAAGGFMNHNTTLARILGRALLCEDLREGEPCNECDNCRAVLSETSMAYIELDAASRGTIDSVRKIVEDLEFVIQGAAKRVYVFDEAHRMSRDSQDVMLKPLEDKKLVGIFCTTEPARIRGTIRSRCEEYPIRKITREDILKRMQSILQQEGVEYEDDALLTVIDHSGGHVRDVINRLEMIAQLGKVDVATVREYLNLSMVSTFYEILLVLGDPLKAVTLVEEACDCVGPDDVLAGLAEAAMNSYRLAHGIFAEFTYVDKDLAQRVHSMYGNQVVNLAEYFLRAPRATKVGLVCDIIRCSKGIPAQVESKPIALPVVVQAPQVESPPVPVVLVPEKAPESPQEASEPVKASEPSLGGDGASESPPEAVTASSEGGNGRRSDGTGDLGSDDPGALTSLDTKARPMGLPRGNDGRPASQRAFQGKEGKKTAEPLTWSQWSRRFARLWTQRGTSSGGD
jgi:DNA polymerase III subunit gamma/tau